MHKTVSGVEALNLLTKGVTLVNRSAQYIIVDDTLLCTIEGKQFIDNMGINDLMKIDFQYLINN